MPPLAHALLAPVTPASRRKVRIRGWFDDLMGKRVEPPPQIQAFLAGASPQAKREYAALQDAFPVGASEDVQREWREFGMGVANATSPLLRATLMDNVPKSQRAKWNAVSGRPRGAPGPARAPA